MIAPDTSVLVAGFVPLHHFHPVAVSALVDVKANGCLVAHTVAETYAVLSSPSGPYRVEPSVVLAYLDRFLERGEPIQPRPRSVREAIEVLGERGRAGGAIYDALIALAARDSGATLVSLDRRAEQTYAACGVEAKMLAA